jgi:hypothetical protein
MFEGKVKCFGLEDFRRMVDNNNHFWEEFRNRIRVEQQQLQQVV